MSHLKKKQGIRILIVEDNPDIAENIADYLEGRGHTLDFAMDGIGGLHLAITQEYDAIVLDIMLPKMDGLTFCRKLRKEGGKQTPVLMLTARDTLDDKLEGFDAGADDYLVKPFALEELAARLGALVRRSEVIPQQLCVADLVFDTGKMKVCRAGKEIKLNRVCLKILQILMQSYPNAVKRAELEQALWGDMPPGSDALRSHIYALRHAVDKPFETALIQTIHGLGYRLVDSNEISS
jgi:DNA-binding response OmpR family regulator